MRGASTPTPRRPPHAALFFRCPGEKRLRTFGESGPVAFGMEREYVGDRQTWVRTYAARKKGVAESAIVYAVCK
jgi:hypothetical protein